MNKRDAVVERAERADLAFAKAVAALTAFAAVLAEALGRGGSVSLRRRLLRRHHPQRDHWPHSGVSEPISVAERRSLYFKVGPVAER